MWNEPSVGLFTRPRAQELPTLFKPVSETYASRQLDRPWTAILHRLHVVEATETRRAQIQVRWRSVVRMIQRVRGSRAYLEVHAFLRFGRT